MPYFIAEIGFNHEGNMDLAVEMIQTAAEAGADAVKFQTFRAFDIALPTSPHYAAIKCGELDLEQHQRLARAAREAGVDFLSTPFSPWAVDLLETIGVPAYKIASMDCTNHHLLSHVAQTKKPIYLSTGMATLAEIAETLEFLDQQGAGAVTLLHCMALYPAAAEDINLSLIPYLKSIFGRPVGYSDHYPGTAACLAAVMLSADVIETHFTLDSKKEGGDHFHSVEPADLKELVTAAALFKTMQGRPESIHDRNDRKCAPDFRRGLYASRFLSSGTRLTETDLLICRPENQLKPNDVNTLLGRTVTVDMPEYAALQPGHVR